MKSVLTGQVVVCSMQTSLLEGRSHFVGYSALYSLKPKPIGLTNLSDFKFSSWYFNNLDGRKFRLSSAMGTWNVSSNLKKEILDLIHKSN